MAGSGCVSAVRVEVIAGIAECGSQLWILPDLPVILYGPGSVAITGPAMASIVARAPVPGSIPGSAAGPVMAS